MTQPQPPTSTQNTPPLSTVGRIVLYALTEQDCEQIARRRTDSTSIRDRLEVGNWPVGAQAHLGNGVSVGQIVPAMIVAVWSPTCVNLRCILDGTDEYWATSRNQYVKQAPEHPDLPPAGLWAWPPRG